MSAALQCELLDAGWDRRAVVRGFNLTVHPGEVVALLGTNGAGKTTTLATIAGLLPALSGTVLLHGRRITHRRSHRLVRDGLVLLPDSRGLFRNLTVLQHLTLAQRKGTGRPEEVFERFPALEARRHIAAGLLSGGEQQMLAVGRALMLRPSVLLIDELSLGLAPIVVHELLPSVAAVAREHGTAVVLVEQHVSLAVDVADRVLVLSHGGIVLDESAEAVRADPTLIERAYFATTPTATTSPTHSGEPEQPRGDTR